MLGYHFWLLISLCMSFVLFIPVTSSVLCFFFISFPYPPCSVVVCWASKLVLNFCDYFCHLCVSFGTMLLDFKHAVFFLCSVCEFNLRIVFPFTVCVLSNF